MILNIFYVTFDGFASMYCGVGAVAQYFLACVPEIRQALEEIGIEPRFHFLYSEVPRDGLLRSATIEARSQRLAKESAIGVYSLPHGATVETPFGASTSWQFTCERAFERIAELVEPNSLSLILANDTPFAPLVVMLAARRVSGPMRVVWLPHSTGKLYPNQLGTANRVRLQWESEAILTSRTNLVVLGATSRFMVSHLVDAWKAARERVVTFTVGVSAKYLERFVRREPAEVEATLKAYGIPERRLLVSFGRADHYKGLDIACKIGRVAADRAGAYPVVCATSYGTASSDEELARLQESSRFDGRNGLLLLEYEFEAPRVFIQSKAVRMVVVPSRAENLSLIPSETRVLGAEHTTIVASRVGGLLEQVSDGVDGFLIDVEDVAESCKKCAKIFAIDEAELERVREAGRRRVLANYCLAENTLSGILAVLEQWDTVPSSLRAVLKAINRSRTASSPRSKGKAGFASRWRF